MKSYETPDVMVINLDSNSEIFDSSDLKDTDWLTEQWG